MVECAIALGFEQMVPGARAEGDAVCDGRSVRASSPSASGSSG
jgi:hypothetical protein